MKLIILLTLVGTIHASAGALGQKITLSAKDAPLETIFREIEKQTGFDFLYNAAWLKATHPVSVDVKDLPLENVLDLCFKDQPFNYSITNNTIVLSQKLVALKVMENDPPSGEMHGKLTNSKGEPLVNANIILKRTKRGTITNYKGEFTLKNVKPDDIVNISFIGYKSQNIKIGDRKKLDLIMEVTTDQLDQVVIQGYGTTSQRFATGDIATVTAEEIEKQPVMNPLMALQGRVAGLDIQQNNGYASAPIKAEIRGRSSIDPSQTNDPLYIVDGVPLTVVNVGGQSSYGNSTGFLQSGLSGPAGGQSPLFSISPSDIESISVLKDADATSIYGSRGANGVILLTTKKGKAGKTQFTIHVDEGVNKISRFWKMLNTPQYLEMRREAFKNDGITPNPGNAPDLLIWDTTKYTDWQKALLGRSGKVINTQMSLSGGNAYTTFRISGNYANSKSITTASGADERGSVAFNLTHTSINRHFTMSFTSTYSFTKSDLIAIGGKINFAPDAPSIFDSTGKLNWDTWRPGGGNRFGSLLQTYSATTNFLNSNLNLAYQPVRGLSFSINFGYNTTQANQLSLIPIASQDPLSQPTGSAYFGVNNNKNWIIEPQANYEKQIGRGKFSVLLGGSAQQNTTDGIFIQGLGYTSDALLHTISNAPSQVSKDNYGEYRYASVFGRIGYNLENKYILNLNARRDGSSNYGPDHQFGNFASIGGAWIFTEENWFKNHFSFLSFGKLRGSYGLAGSEGGRPYGYITRWSSNGLFPYSDVIPLVATQLANPDYHWQEDKKLEGAIDLGFFKDWITVSIAYYRKRTGDQLLSYPTAATSGFSSVVDNLNALVQNAGWEFSINGKGVHVQSKYFNWDWAPHFTFSVNQNKFLSFSGLAASPFRDAGLIGHPLNGSYILHYTGVDPQTGQYTYQDKNHDGAINPNFGTTGDVYFRKTSPSFSTGFGFNFDVKGFGIALFFVIKKQDGINALAQGNGPGGFNANQPVEVLGRWRNPGDITNVGKFSVIGSADPNGYISSSDIGLTDASYIRLQNLSVSYNLPSTVSKKAGFQCSIFLHANNLLTITKYKGIDPETQNFGGMPPAKTLVGGLSFNF